MPALMDDGEGCCGACDMFGTCGYSYTCKCHNRRGGLETSLRDLNAAAREVPRGRWADTDPEYAL